MATHCWEATLYILRTLRKDSKYAGPYTIRFETLPVEGDERLVLSYRTVGSPSATPFRRLQLSRVTRILDDSSPGHYIFRTENSVYKIADAEIISLLDENGMIPLSLMGLQSEKYDACRYTMGTQFNSIVTPASNTILIKDVIE